MKFQLFFNFFDSFSTLFSTFGTPGSEGPGNSFSTPFPTLGPKGPELAPPLWGLKGRKVYLVDVSDIFYFFFPLGERGKGGVRGARRGGVHFLLRIPGGGGGVSRRGRMAGTVSAAN